MCNKRDLSEFEIEMIVSSRSVGKVSANPAALVKCKQVAVINVYSELDYQKENRVST